MEKRLRTIPWRGAGSNITPDESVYLSAGSGLAAGVYPLLPARYALLPGAYLVSVASGNFQDQPPGVVGQAGNGFPIVSGYFTNGTTGIGATRNDRVLDRARHLCRHAGQIHECRRVQLLCSHGYHYRGPVERAAGGRRHPIGVGCSPGFTALGTINGAPAAGGEGATVELVAPQITVVPDGTGTIALPGLVQLSSNVIEGWNAGRLWLGLNETNGSAQVGASTVEVASGARLSADEIVLAATGSVQVDAGASVLSNSAATGTATPAAATAAASNLPLSSSSNSAAVLIASDLDYWLPQRSGVPAALPRTITIAAGAMVGSRGSIIIDAPGGGALGDGSLMGCRVKHNGR